jgi:hypothetical protein
MSQAKGRRVVKKEAKVVGIGPDTLWPSIDRSQGSVSAFQAAMLIIPWQGACDTYYEFLRVRVPPTYPATHTSIRTISYVDSAGTLCKIIAGRPVYMRGNAEQQVTRARARVHYLRDVLFISKII